MKRRKSDYRADYDPSRVMPNGEMVYQARDRLKGWGIELKLQAMALVSSMFRDTELELAAIEDEVYSKRFGLDRFPRGGKAVGPVKSLIDLVNGGSG